MDKMEAYFDNSATTRVFDCVKDAVVNAMTVDYGNAAARHMKGVEAERRLPNLSRYRKKRFCLPPAEQNPTTRP